VRGEWLGSAGITVLVRCACGAKLYLSRPHWSRRGFTVCDDCKAVILYASLEVVDPNVVEEFLSMFSTEREEREALTKALERELRSFIRVFDRQPEWLWSPATVRFVQSVRPKVEKLGGAIKPAQGGDVAEPEGAYRGAE
jgi:hypothetical protein